MVKIVLIPMKVVPGDIQSNWELFKDSIEYASRLNADIAVFPEYCLTGFREWSFSGARYYDTFLCKVKRLANEYSLWVIYGVLEPCNNTAYNTALLVDNQGNILLKHRKIEEPMMFCRGRNFQVTETTYGRIGIAICGDLYNKFIERQVKKLKPDYLFVPMDYQPETVDLDEEKEVLSRRARTLNTMLFVVNTYMHNGSFGTAWVFNEKGELLGFTPRDKPLVIEI